MKISKTAGRALIAVALIIAPLTPVSAGSCGYENCWGAVALGEFGRTARASGFRTAPGAWARAERVCGRNCATIEVFNNGCGVIVQDSGAALSTGFAVTRAGAAAEALGACALAGGASCRIRVWACSK